MIRLEEIEKIPLIDTHMHRVHPARAPEWGSLGGGYIPGPGQERHGRQTVLYGMILEKLRQRFGMAEDASPEEVERERFLRYGKQYNEKNGTDYVIEIMDDKGDPKEAVNVANLIVSDPTVIAGMGSFSSSCAMAAAPVFEEADLLLFSPNASHTDFPAMGENMFSAVMSQKYEGAEFADALIEMFGAQNVAILYQNTDHGVIATDVFTKQYEAGGGKVIMSETFIPGQTKDFSPVLSRIKEQDPDLFYVNASYNDCAQIFMQAKALNMDCQLVGPGMLLTEEFLDVVGNKIDGTIVMSSVPAFLPSVLESGELDAASKNFVDSYTAEYNEVPDGFAASAFDAVNIVLDAVAKVGTDTPALREELKTLRDYPGVSGYNMSFNEQKEMVKGIYLFEIQDGQFVRVK